MNIAVIGAGVIGVTSAIAIKRAFPKASVTIYADVFTPETTGDGSAGLWGPFILGDTSDTDFIRWGGETHRWFESFWKRGFADNAGICLVPVTRVRRASGFAMPAWKSIVYGAVELTDEELSRWGKEHGTTYGGGMHFVTFTAEPTRFLPWLMKKFVSVGGIMRKKRINSFEELEKDGYETVINCSGLGARELANDSSLIPIRGQVTRVKAPWAFNVFIEEDNPGNYIIPNIETVVTGGSASPNDYDTQIRYNETKFIRDGCMRILPALAECEVVKLWSGLRPKRTEIRLEREVRSRPNGTKFQIVHNYGHGGAGVTVCWGCALHVVQILKENESKEKLRLSSNL